jgi:hypothetical protein
LGRTLLEDTVLELSACGSPMVVWRRCGASSDRIVSTPGDFRQSLLWALPPRRAFLVLHVGLWAALVGSSWWSASCGVVCDGEVYRRRACSMSCSLGELRPDTVAIQSLPRPCVVFVIVMPASLIVSVGVVCVLVNWIHHHVSCHCSGCY